MKNVAFHCEEDGHETVESLLLLAGAILPLAFVIFQLVKALARYYAQISYIVSLPF